MQDDWFDAHTHIGQNDPDGRKATPEEILGGLDAAGHQRAMLFAMHEPDGYPAANDAVLAAAAASEGRLRGARAHRSERRGRGGRGAPLPGGGRRAASSCTRARTPSALPHPVVEEVVALAHERRAPVLFHAGRGIPHLGEAVVDLARRYPGARLILAHAGISDLGWIADDAAALDNLFFDTAWWNVADQLQLYATIPPGRILYASDMPYAPGLLAVLRLPARGARGRPRSRRPALDRRARSSRASWPGRTPSTLGPAPGPDAVGRRVIEAERVVTYCAAGLQVAFRGLDPSEPIALARLACRTCRDGDVRALLTYIDTLLAIGQESAAAHPDVPFAIMPATLLAMVLAGTPEAGLPSVAV